MIFGYFYPQRKHEKAKPFCLIDRVAQTVQCDFSNGKKAWATWIAGLAF